MNKENSGCWQKPSLAVVIGISLIAGAQADTSWPQKEAGAGIGESAHHE